MLPHDLDLLEQSLDSHKALIRDTSYLNQLGSQEWMDIASSSFKAISSVSDVGCMTASENKMMTPPRWGYRDILQYYSSGCSLEKACSSMQTTDMVSLECCLQ